MCKGALSQEAHLVCDVPCAVDVEEDPTTKFELLVQLGESGVCESLCRVQLSLQLQHVGKLTGIAHVGSDMQAAGHMGLYTKPMSRRLVKS